MSSLDVLHLRKQGEVARGIRPCLVQYKCVRHGVFAYGIVLGRL